MTVLGVLRVSGTSCVRPTGHHPSIALRATIPKFAGSNPSWGNDPGVLVQQRSVNCTRKVVSINNSRSAIMQSTQSKLTVQHLFVKSLEILNCETSLQRASISFKNGVAWWLDLWEIEKELHYR